MKKGTFFTITSVLAVAIALTAMPTMAHYTQVGYAWDDYLPDLKTAAAADKIMMAGSVEDIALLFEALYAPQYPLFGGNEAIFHDDVFYMPIGDRRFVPYYLDGTLGWTNLFFKQRIEMARRILNHVGTGNITLDNETGNITLSPNNNQNQKTDTDGVDTGIPDTAVQLAMNSDGARWWDNGYLDGQGGGAGSVLDAPVMAIAPLMDIAPFSANSNTTIDIAPLTDPILYTVWFSVTGGNDSISAKREGEISIATGTVVAEGESVVFTASPISSYRVKEWKLNGSAIAGNKTNTYTLTSLSADATVTVEFELIDTTAPTVSSVTAALSGNVVITFNEKMNTTAGVGAVKLYRAILSEETTLTGGTWNTPTDTVFTIPYSGLDPDFEYQVRISGFKDAEGNVMADDNSNKFTTLLRVIPKSLTGVTSPVANVPPSTAINNDEHFTSSLSWNGSPSTFAYSTVYTATITLTAASGYTFGSGIYENSSQIALFKVNGIDPVWVSNNGTTLVFTITFPATEAAPPDTTPPVLSAGTVYRTSNTAASIGFTTTESGMLYYLVKDSGTTPEPTSAQVREGTPLDAVLSGAVTGKAVILTAGAKDIYIVVEDNAGNISVPLKITALDATAPTLTAGDVNRTSDTAATISFTTNEAGTAYYKVVDKGVTAPAFIAGDLGTSLGAVSVGANTGKAVTLTAGAKDIYVVVEDMSGNISEPLKIVAAAYAAPDTTPPTGLADMTAWSIAMYALIVMSLMLWGYVGYTYIPWRKS